MKYLSVFLCHVIADFNQLKKILIKQFITAILFGVFACTSTFINASENDSDGDGLPDALEVQIGSEAYLSDTDGDGVKDGVEVGKNLEVPLDTDSDSIIDVLDYDDDNDGLPTFLESKVDSDKDGLVDYLDTDSDNDGITDGEEAGVLNQDKNFDGVDDAFDTNRVGAVDDNGDGIDDNVSLPDHNQDGKPDYLDVNYQNIKTKKILVDTPSIKSKEIASLRPLQTKPINKEDNTSTDFTAKIENINQISSNTVVSSPLNIKKKKATAKEMVINRHTDSDNDGLSNSLEKRLGTNHLNRDSDGDNVSDAIEIGLDVNSPQDSDRDGLIDALDDDDDNDGILTKLEDLNKDSTAINDDTDADGVPNYLDANDDGDDKLTKDEGFALDSDQDGILDYLDKNDGMPNVNHGINKTANLNEGEKSSEPEIIVLFDGNAADLVDKENEDFTSSDEAQDPIDNALAEVSVEGTETKINNEDTKLSDKSESVKTSNNYKSHWNLF